MPKDKNTTDTESKDLILNNNLPCIHIDGISINIREDNFYLVRLLSSLPEGAYEQARFMISDEDYRGFVESMCEAIDYYPAKPQETATKSRKKS